ncbi:hypothetical protein PC110_g15194 [Phytophthora cactorum]|uniref:Uncharacterized protein n=2 Tax=Phytophthora cactorum TaxID=29920 RepID=A0A329RUQ3_9STRA|nr:hypothetical protein PC110_g15194 [Phytophthora cactorum]
MTPPACQALQAALEGERDKRADDDSVRAYAMMAKMRVDDSGFDGVMVVKGYADFHCTACNETKTTRISLTRAYM